MSSISINEAIAHTKPATTEEPDQAIFGPSASPTDAATDFPFEATPNDSSDARLYLAAMTQFFSSFLSDRHREDADGEAAS